MGIGALYSDQETNRRAVPIVLNELNTKGRVHRLYFSHTVGAADDVDAGTTVALCLVPAGARFVGGLWYNDTTWANGAVTINIGDSGDADRFAAAIACTAENVTAIPNTAAEAAKCIGYKFPEDTMVYLTTAAAALAAGGVAKGYIDIVFL